MITFVEGNGTIESSIAAFIINTATTCMSYGIAIKVFKALHLALISYVG